MSRKEGPRWGQGCWFAKLRGHSAEDWAAVGDSINPWQVVSTVGATNGGSLGKDTFRACCPLITGTYSPGAPSPLLTSLRVSKDIDYIVVTGISQTFIFL